MDSEWDGGRLHEGSARIAGGLPGPDLGALEDRVAVLARGFPCTEEDLREGLEGLAAR